MGSFLYTCFASKQTIIEESKVIIIPIIKQSGYYDCELKRNGKILSQKIPQEFSSNVYANCYWKPLGLYFEGIAEDCGRQSIIDNEHNRISY